MLRDLHWLQTLERIDFKLARRYLSSKADCFFVTASKLISSHDHFLHSCFLFLVATPRIAVAYQIRLRSASTSTLVVPSTRRSTLGDRAFPVAAARAWNSLPSSVRSTSSLASFCLHQLFAASFPR